MRFVLLAALFLACTTTALPQARRSRPSAKTPSTSVEQDQKAIDDLHQRDIAASLAFDVEKLAGLWDEKIVSMPPNSSPLVGMEANRAFLMKNREKMASVDILSYEERWDEVRVVGEYAFEYGSINSRMRGEDAKQETALEFNVMRVLKRQPDGDWKIYRTIWNDRKPAEQPTPPPKPEVKD
jgi:ketosteroid isomerase-like protein